MRRNYSNTAVATTLAAGITDSDVSLTVADATGYPDPPFTITIGSEVILVGAKVGTTFSSLTRGYDGTVAAAHDSGASVEHAVVAEDMASTNACWMPLVFGVGHFIGMAATSAHSSRAVSNDSIGFVPLVLNRRAILAGLGVAVEAAGSSDGTVKFLLFGSDPITGRPDPSRLIAQLGTVDVTTTGEKKIDGLSVDLGPGVYWVACRSFGFTTPPQLYCAMSDRAALGAPTLAKDWGRPKVHRPYVLAGSCTSDTEFTSGSTNDSFAVPVFIVYLTSP